MMKLDFKDWILKETGTFTNAIATFSQPFMGMVTRGYNTEEKKKKKKKKIDK